MSDHDSDRGQPRADTRHAKFAGLCSAIYCQEGSHKITCLHAGTILPCVEFLRGLGLKVSFQQAPQESQYA